MQDVPNNEKLNPIATAIAVIVILATYKLKLGIALSLTLGFAAYLAIEHRRELKEVKKKWTSGK